MVGVDTGFYKYGWLYHGTDRTVYTVDKDIRHLTVDDLAGVDAVVHMAELSNDPLGALAPDVTYEINHQGSVRLAKLAKEAGVERFVYMSSCSVYGVATGERRHRDLAGQPADRRTPSARCSSSGTSRALADDDVLADVPAQRHRVRRLAADAVRHRPEQPGRARLDHEPRSR